MADPHDARPVPRGRGDHALCAALATAAAAAVLGYCLLAIAGLA